MKWTSRIVTGCCNGPSVSAVSKAVRMTEGKLVSADGGQIRNLALKFISVFLFQDLIIRDPYLVSPVPGREDKIILLAAAQENIGFHLLAVIG